MPSSFRFGTVGSPIATPKKPGGSVGATIYTRELGMGALELGWVRSVRVSEATCEAIKQASAEHDVLLSVHAPYFINLNADEEEWPKSRKRLMDAAHFGNLAGATEIIFHPGSYFGNPAEEVLPTAIKRLAGCVEELRANQNPVTLRPETMGKSAMLGSLEDSLAMSKTIEGVKPCLDFAHLHARAGDGTINSYDEWCSILESNDDGELFAGDGFVLGRRVRQQHANVHLVGAPFEPIEKTLYAVVRLVSFSDEATMFP